MTEHSVLAEGLRSPEGPIAMPDGSIVLVEIARGTGPGCKLVSMPWETPGLPLNFLDLT